MYQQRRDLYSSSAKNPLLESRHVKKRSDSEAVLTLVDSYAKIRQGQEELQGARPRREDMPVTDLVELLERNQSHTESMEPGWFDDLQAGQEPAAVSMCCSDSRVSQEGMFSVTEPGWLFTPSTIGNQVWDYHDGDRVVDGSVLYPLVKTGTELCIVVGHTGCGAVSAALGLAQGESEEMPPGIAKSIRTLEPVIEAGLADERIDSARSTGLVDQLVEYNVDRQVEFLLKSGDVPKSVTVLGFVYDFQRVYGEVPGRVYLVNADGETDVSTLRYRLPDRLADHVNRLL